MHNDFEKYSEALLLFAIHTSYNGIWQIPEKH
jgi:hypothetical protein